jgi:hypothetical protein
MIANSKRRDVVKGLAATACLVFALTTLPAAAQDPRGRGVMNNRTQPGPNGGVTRGFDPLWPAIQPQPPLPKKDDRQDKPPFGFHPIHPGHLPSFQPEETLYAERSVGRGISEVHPSFRPTSAFRGFGAAIGKGIAGVFAGLGAAIAGILGAAGKRNRDG